VYHKIASKKKKRRKQLWHIKNYATNQENFSAKLKRAETGKYFATLKVGFAAHLTAEIHAILRADLSEEAIFWQLF
jgi:hypothetical protein